MFRVIRKFIKKTMDSIHHREIDKTNAHVIVAISPDMAMTEPVVNAIVEPAPDMEMPPLETKVNQLEYDNYKYQPDVDVILEWNKSTKNNLVPLIAMIRQLLFFSDLKKSTIRTYSFSKDEIVSIIAKTKRRPSLEIDVSDIDIYDHPQIFRMYRNMQSIIGMHRTNQYMVRVEHAFDNSQIRSEHFVVSRVMNIATKQDTVVGCGIDSVHHIVLPIHVELKNISKIPSHVRTIFHHISYSIQPFVFHSQTLDTWLKNEANPTNAQIMQLCIQLAEAVSYLHDLNIVHGDIKPGNTLVKKNGENDGLFSLSLYLIDFGMSGNAETGDGTGGTIPFCAPETGNGVNATKSSDNDTYKWTKVQKHHDVWSIGIMFFTIIVFRKSYVFPKNYPSDFFDSTGHINPDYFDKIQNESMRNLFRQALLPATERITSHEFLTLARNVHTDIIDTVDVDAPLFRGSGGSDDRSSGSGGRNCG